MSQRLITSLLIALSLSIMAGFAFAQGMDMTRGEATATIGGSNVTIDYGQPSLKGRELSELLSKLPEERIWRAGMNQVTTLSTDKALSIGGTTVPAGKYSLYVHIPENGDWSLLVNKDQGVALGSFYAQAPDNLKEEPWPHLGTYNEKIKDQEVVRTKMTKASGGSEDRLMIDLSDDGTLTMSWGTESWTAKIGSAN
jgi:hypothetical protein